MSKNKKEPSWFKNPQVQVAFVAGVLALVGVLFPVILNRPPPPPTNTPIPIPTDTPIPIPTDTPPPTPTDTLTPTPTNTPTLTPTNTPTSTPTPPITCNDAAIVSGIFAQLAEVNTFSFIDIGPDEVTIDPDNVVLECQGIYDLSHEMPPAIKIEYDAVDNSFAFFSIGISDGFDASDYKEICVWIYAEAPGQQFDLKLKDTDDIEVGIGLTTTKMREWEEHCVKLLGYTGVELSSIAGITLSFNDEFGDVDIRVDDFELR